jgi:diacylglycerol O-acyltransferase
MTKLPLIDGGFLLTESHHSPRHVAGLQIFRLPKGKGSAWLRSLLTEMRQAKPGFPFNQRLLDTVGLQYELERDQHLDIDYHVRHTVLPRPGDDKQLLEVVARMHANLLDRERPLWEFHLIEGLSQRRFAFYIKLHHALGDGVTANRWTLESLSASAREMAVRPIWQRDEMPAGSDEQDVSYAQMLIDGIKYTGGGLKTAMDLSSLTAKIVQRRFFDRDSQVALPLSAPRTSLNAPTGAARSLTMTSYPLERVRAVGKSRGATINDVVMTLCDMALHRYFEQHGDAHDGPLVAYMPVNIRTEDDDGDGNYISLLQVKLASSHQDSLSTLEEVRASLASAREVYSGASRSAVQYYSLMVALLAQFQEALKLGEINAQVTNLVISNVPGPKKPLYVKGAELLGIYPVSTLPPLTALNVTAVSYVDRLNFGLIAARTAIPDLPLLTSYLDDAFRELAEATAAPIVG